MLSVYEVGREHHIRVHVDANGTQCECPVLVTDGVGLILAPQVFEIQREFRQSSVELLLAMQKINRRIHSLRMSTES